MTNYAKKASIAGHICIDSQNFLILSCGTGSGHNSACAAISSAEAAVIGTVLIHITPIPGCETYNMHFAVLFILQNMISMNLKNYNGGIGGSIV